MLIELAEVSVMSSGHVGIDQSLLGEPLAVVKRSGDFERSNVLPERGELFFLRRADASGGIKDDDANAGNAEKRLRHRASCVSRSGHDHGEFLARFGHEISHQPGHEARPEILEGQRRAREKLENMQPLAERSRAEPGNRMLRR